ncbi:diol dehydratase small subunit [Mycobacterium aquaticum]|uniref:Propanediol utilization protein n=1 Tax=Mycobacterium aquaticum TaxID=1927124 RepID=A0A1X0AS82_9MYCO|nr:diol dehydratase small subunit [Mycobacterium aquaticum]ORA32879.1 propanediol utilization protein [Mycobacterium aquaticum]
MTATSHSGRSVHDVTVEAARNGALTLDDVRISRETLLGQADIADQAGSVQLAQNLRRASELTALSAEDMLAAYEALRPGRSTFEELHAVADRLAAQEAHTCAEFVREAAAVYRRRGLLR